jgi:hypothetical protein
MINLAGPGFKKISFVILDDHLISNLKSTFRCILQIISKNNENGLFAYFGHDTG